MYCSFKELDIFPDKQIIELHKPACFKNKYKGKTVIIDATEIYIEKPSIPEAQQLTFSTYYNGLYGEAPPERGYLFHASGI